MDDSKAALDSGSFPEFIHSGSMREHKSRFSGGRVKDVSNTDTKLTDTWKTKTSTEKEDVL